MQSARGVAYRRQNRSQVTLPEFKGFWDGREIWSIVCARCETILPFENVEKSWIVCSSLIPGVVVLVDNQSGFALEISICRCDTGGELCVDIILQFVFQACEIVYAKIDGRVVRRSDVLDSHL